MQHRFSPSSPAPDAALLLADGTVLWGRGFGATGAVAGEICFNTAMTGYQEILTDPSYHGQIITFTFPHIGNVGCNPDDSESHAEKRWGASGLVVREKVTLPSNFRAMEPFQEWLDHHRITGISGVDTRALTRHIRGFGAQNAVILYAAPERLAQEIAEWRQKLASHPTLDGMELAATVTTKRSYVWHMPRWAETESRPSAPLHHVVAIDYGEKLNILRSLVSVGCRVTVVPGHSAAEEILALSPDGVFLSNGPGDPAATAAYAVPVIQRLIAANLPIFGICLGHQMLALALGAQTRKMHQGHRGANHPVQRLSNGSVEITSQNHGFVVDEASLPASVTVTHRSLFDRSIEGIALEGKPVFSVQYHPESSPGPHDSVYLFHEFAALMAAYSSDKRREHHARTH